MLMISKSTDLDRMENAEDTILRVFKKSVFDSKARSVISNDTQIHNLNDF